MGKTIVFSDFDGTITLQDSNDYMTDNVGLGHEKRVALNQDCLHDRKTFRETFEEMMESINLPFPECIKLLEENIRLDPGFIAFNDFCIENDIPIIVLSSGMQPIIRALLIKLVGEEKGSKIPIVSNDVKYLDPEGSKWEIQFHDDSDFGHDKSLAIREYQEKHGSDGTYFYCGDGVSDLSAARETDLLFAKVGRDLVTYCEKENVPFKVFESFSDIHEDVKNVVTGKTSVNQLAQNGASK